jgi:Kef-type K+ transport system membrane component KefB
VIGVLAIASVLVKVGLERARVPPMAGYLVLGAVLGAVAERTQLVSEFGRHAIELLAAIGIIVLLFRVGLESDPSKLVRQLPNAGFALLGSIVPSAVLGMLAVRYLLGADLVPSLFAGVALTATSVGISLAPWREAGAIDSDSGALLLDLAELDDLAGVILMVLLLAAVPAVQRGDGLVVGPLVGSAAWLLVLLAVFTSLCLLFARYAEPPLTRRFGARSSDLTVLVAGVSFVIAAVAGWLGLSLAIGAVFAGLAFSRDPRRRAIGAAFGSLFQLFTPFFFIGIGFSLRMHAPTAAAVAAAVLLVVGIIGKLGGTGLAVATTSGSTAGLLVGASMVPRAEIAMIIMEHGRRMGETVVPDTLYAGMVLMCLASSVLASLVVPLLLRRYPQAGGRRR